MLPFTGYPTWLESIDANVVEDCDLDSWPFKGELYPEAWEYPLPGCKNMPCWGNVGKPGVMALLGVAEPLYDIGLPS